MKWYSIGIVVCLIFLTMQGVLAVSLISFEKSITPNPYDTENLISNAGIINIPPGYGILTTNEIIQPYWGSNNNDLPIRIEFSPVNPDVPDTVISLIGIDYYQFGNEVSGDYFSNGVPLNIVTKYFTNTTATTPYNILLYNSLDKGDAIHDYDLTYSAEYEPLPVNLTKYESGYPSGIFNSNRGLVNMSLYLENPSEMVPILNGNFEDGNQIFGALHGPVWFGDWRSNQTIIEKPLSKDHIGKFFVVFNENLSSFSGTIGNQLSCMNAGSFTGEKEGI